MLSRYCQEFEDMYVKKSGCVKEKSRISHYNILNIYKWTNGSIIYITIFILCTHSVILCTTYKFKIVLNIAKKLFLSYAINMEIPENTIGLFSPRIEIERERSKKRNHVDVDCSCAKNNILFLFGRLHSYISFSSA